MAFGSVQTVSHEKQFLTSVCRLTHAPVQQVQPVGQVLELLQPGTHSPVVMLHSVPMLQSASDMHPVHRWVVVLQVWFSHVDASQAVELQSLSDAQPK